MTQNVKFNTAVNTLKSDVQMTWSGEINTEEDFNKVQWIIDKDSNDTALQLLLVLIQRLLGL